MPGEALQPLRDGSPDGAVGVLDLLRLLTLMDCSATEASLCAQYGDVAGSSNGMPDGVVNVSDLLFMLQMYNSICPQRSDVPQSLLWRVAGSFKWPTRWCNRLGVNSSHGPES